MRRRIIKHKNLVKLLKNIGFIEMRTSGVHLIFSYPQRGAKVVIKRMKPNEIVPQFIFASVKRTIKDKGIATEEKIEYELDGL